MTRKVRLRLIDIDKQLASCLGGWSQVISVSLGRSINHVPLLYVFLRTWSRRRTAAKPPPFHHRPLCVKSRASATGKCIKPHGNRLKRKTPFGAIVAFLLRFWSRFHATHLLSYSACLTYCRAEMYRPPTTAPVTALKTNRCWPSFIDRPTMQVTYHEWIWRLALEMMWWVDKSAWESGTRRTI